MGFGYLFIGYLLTFVLKLTLDALGWGALALLMGYAVMFWGLWLLTHYQSAFAWAKWTLIPLIVTALYDLLGSFNETFLWGLPIFGGAVETVYEWVTLALIVFFNLAMLYGIMLLAREVELGHIATKAIRNAVIVGLFAVLQAVAYLPIPEQVKRYMTLAVLILDVLWICCNLLLLISCAKNICPAGDEDQPAKPYRWELLNRIGNAYNRNFEKAAETRRRESEEFLRRRQEKKNRKK